MNILTEHTTMKTIRSCFFALTLVVLTTGCTKDDPEEDPSFFSVSMGKVVSRAVGPDDRYPYMHIPYMVMKGLPEGERLLYLQGCYSRWTDSPDTTDYICEADCSDDRTTAEWDRISPLVLSPAGLIQLLPGRTYYFRGTAVTDRGTYRTHTIEIRSERTTPLSISPEAYRIPVIFHLFADEGGRYPNADILYDMLEYANVLYSNYYGLPHQCDAKVCFVPAERDPQGRPLERPGIRYEREKVYVDAAGEVHGIDYENHLWDMEQALNVWVCPFGKIAGDETVLGGFSNFPYFDEAHLLPGGSVYDPRYCAGIFINSRPINLIDNLYVFAHEAGHFLGLWHVFGEDWCDDTPRYDREAYLSRMDDLLYEREYADAPGSYFFSDNVMDYFYSVYSGITPAQAERIRHTLRYAYHIPGEAGMTAPRLRSGGAVRFPPNPVW